MVRGKAGGQDNSQQWLGNEGSGEKEGFWGHADQRDRGSKGHLWQTICAVWEMRWILPCPGVLPAPLTSSLTPYFCAQRLSGQVCAMGVLQVRKRIWWGAWRECGMWDKKPVKLRTNYHLSEIELTVGCQIIHYWSLVSIYLPEWIKLVNKNVQIPQ